uniref:Uncharacterized protein n=1 Tax=Anguilla anguilla TaxID=7936 RepID=A0A0E9Q4M2_ANGAN
MQCLLHRRQDACNLADEALRSQTNHRFIFFHLPGYASSYRSQIQAGHVKDS